MRVEEKDTIWIHQGVPVEELPDPLAQPALQPEELEPRAPRRRRWRIVLYSSFGLIFVTVLWLVITAPLSRALEPLADPALLL